MIASNLVSMTVCFAVTLGPFHFLALATPSSSILVIRIHTATSDGFGFSGCLLSGSFILFTCISKYLIWTSSSIFIELCLLGFICTCTVSLIKSLSSPLTIKGCYKIIGFSFYWLLLCNFVSSRSEIWKNLSKNYKLW